MIAIFPLIDGCSVAGTDASFSNPLQGLLFHWILVNFFVYGCEKKYFAFKGLSIIAAEGSTSECAQVRAASEAKYKQLLENCKNRCIRVPNFNAYFFKFSESKVILEADRSEASRLYDNEYCDDAEVADSDDVSDDDDEKSDASLKGAEEDEEIEGLDNSDEDSKSAPSASKRSRR